MTESENMEEKTNSKNNYVNLSAIYATQQIFIIGSITDNLF